MNNTSRLLMLITKSTDERISEIKEKKRTSSKSNWIQA
jgi:hypothetical protein